MKINNRNLGTFDTCAHEEAMEFGLLFSELLRTPEKFQRLPLYHEKAVIRDAVMRSEFIPRALPILRECRYGSKECQSRGHYSTQAELYCELIRNSAQESCLPYRKSSVVERFCELTGSMQLYN